jgi:hypothetical protein
MTRIDKDEIVRLTEEYGGEWAINHTRRLLHLVSLIGKGQEYNADAVWLAAHLHDWGGYAKWARPGVSHATRSRQVAEAFLAEKGYSKDLIELVLECIELHHTGDPDKSMEAILLSDADALDFLGVVGILRDFSKNPRDLKKGYETTKKRRPWDYVLAAMANVKGAVYNLALVASTVTAVQAGASEDLSQVALWGSIGIGCLIASLFLLGNLGLHSLRPSSSRS